MSSRKRGRKRTACPRCSLTTCEHCRCEGCAECDHEPLGCDKTRYPKRTMCTSCIKKRDKLRKASAASSAALAVSEPSWSRREGDLDMLGAFFSRAAAFKEPDPSLALRRAFEGDPPRFAKVAAALSDLFPTLRPRIPDMPPRPPGIDGLEGHFFRNFDTCASHVAWTTGLGGSDLWDGRPLVMDGAAFVDASPLASTRGAHMVVTTRGRVLHVSPALAQVDSMRPYAHATVEHSLAPSSIWENETVGFGRPLDRIAALLASLALDPGPPPAGGGGSGGGGGHHPACGPGAPGAYPSALSSASSSPDSLPLGAPRAGCTDRAYFEADLLRLEAALLRAGAEAAAPAALAVSARFTASFKVHPSAPSVPGRVSIAPLRPKDRAPAGPGGPLLHVALVPHSLAPVFARPLGADCAGTPARRARVRPSAGAQCAESLLEGSLPPPATGADVVWRTRRVRRGREFVPRHFPAFVTPLLRLYFAAPAAAASSPPSPPRAPSVSSCTPPPWHPGAGVVVTVPVSSASGSTRIVACSCIVDEEGGGAGAGGAGEPRRKARRPALRSPSSTSPQRAQGAVSVPVQGAVRSVSDAYTLAGCLAGTPLGSLREEIARLRGVFGLLQDMAARGEEPGRMAAVEEDLGSDAWVAADEATCAANAVRKVLWWLIAPEAVREHAEAVERRRALAWAAPAQEPPPAPPLAAAPAASGGRDLLHRGHASAAAAAAATAEAVETGEGAPWPLGLASATGGGTSPGGEQPASPGAAGFLDLATPLSPGMGSPVLGSGGLGSPGAFPRAGGMMPTLDEILASMPTV